jgi:hypothetical protein
MQTLAAVHACQLAAEALGAITLSISAGATDQSLQPLLLPLLSPRSAVQPVAAAIADSIGLNDQPQLIDTRGWQMTTESTAPFLSITRDDTSSSGVSC